MMNETLNIQDEDFYEPPTLSEVGEFADLTRGSSGSMPEGIMWRQVWV